MTILHKMFLFITFPKLLQIISNNFIKILHHLHSSWNFMIRDFSQTCYDTFLLILGTDVKYEKFVKLDITWVELRFPIHLLPPQCSLYWITLSLVPTHLSSGSLVINSGVIFFLHCICCQVPLTLSVSFFLNLSFSFSV